MLMPPLLTQRIDKALEEIRSHPEHRLEAKRRRMIYEAFGEKSDLVAKRARGWLAVLTAQYVLPIGEKFLPNEDIPRRLVTLAQRVLEGTVDPQVASKREIVEGVDIQDWGYPEESPWNVYIAGKTGDRALMETLGQDPFALGVVWIPDQNMTMFVSDAREVHGVPMDQWSDEMLAENFGDTASAAAVAFACDPLSPTLKCDPDKFLAFWEWWLIEAIPMAWEKASMPNAFNSP